MIRAQKFTVKPNGAVKSGDVSYSADTATGRIDYSGQVVVGIWPISKTVNVPPNSFYMVDPLLLLSTRLQKPGDTVKLGNVTFTVTAIKPGQSIVAVSVQGSTPMNGTATIDTSAQFIRVTQLLAKVSVPILGSLTIEADAVFGGRRKRGLIARIEGFLHWLSGPLERGD